MKCLFIALEVKKYKKKRNFYVPVKRRKKKNKIDNVYSMILCNPRCQCQREPELGAVYEAF